MNDLHEYISPYDTYCDGYSSPDASGNGYFIGLAMGIGKCKREFTHDGNSILDEINAFDKAEVHDVNIGQINMSIVSSFCGPVGAIWGYHVVRPKHLFSPHPYFPKAKVSRNGIQAPVYSAQPLIDATRALFGTVDDRRFPLLPGAHVPCAGKNIKQIGPRHIYAGFGLGIAKNQKKDANLLMEDLGDLPMYIKGTDREAEYKGIMIENIAKSVLAIGENQHVAYKEIFVEIKDVFVQPDELGCALVAAPYFTLARHAIPSRGIEMLQKLSLDEWERDVGL